MKTLFLFLYLVNHPAFDPCNTGVPHTCYAIESGPAWDEQKYALFETRAAAEGFIRKEGKGGKLVDLTTLKEEQIYVKAVMKKVKETVEKEVVETYEIIREHTITGATAGSITYRFTEQDVKECVFQSPFC